ncbi:MAG TPA: DUF4388 domain-containing protein [Ktedonobacterales bacterium]
MSNGSVFSGRLEEFRLVELLQMMALGSNTGALHLYQEHPNGDRTGLIYFDNGALVSCTELDTEALTLGHVLQQLNLASATQIDHAFKLQTQDPLGKRIGERLVDLKILTEDQLDQALKTQTLWTARELALWREGTYEFHSDERLPADAANQRIDSTRAVMEVLRYEHEWESLQPFLPDGMRTHIAMAFEPPIGHPLQFHAAAWRVISRVNSQLTVRRIATSLHQPEVDVARMIGPLIQEGLLVPVGAAGGPGLPEEAARLSMQHFDLFTLLISMEQDWIKKKSPADQLIALASFINQTMRTLEEACQSSGLGLSPDTLASILSREGLLGIDNYRFHVEHNRLDVDNFAAFCRQVLDGTSRGALGSANLFYETCLDVLQRALAASFNAINARVASPIERAQNQEAWEALFLTFRGESSGSVL